MDLFKEFTNQVFNAYEIKKGTKDLATELENPAGAKLRDRCLIILADQRRKKDHDVLRDFFDPKGQSDDLETRMKKPDVPDMLKPLANFMKNKVSKTEEKNVKLLAALINFEPRPYEEWRKWFQEQQVSSNIVNKETEGKSTTWDQEFIKETTEEQSHLSRKNEDDVQPLFGGKTTARPVEETTIIENDGEKPNNNGSKADGDSGKPRKKWWSSEVRMATLSFCTALTLSSGIYVIQDRVNPNGCMIWEDDHYKRTACKPRADDVSVIAYDEAQAEHFRKIKDEDTITYNSIGKVWYSKIDNRIEFFTGDGNHPIFTKKELKPITMHIIDTYVINRK